MRERVVESGSCRDGSSSRRGEEGSVDDSHRDGGCSHGEVGHGCSSRQMEGSRRRDGKVVESVSGSGRCGGPRLGSVAMSRSSHIWV